MYEDAHLEMAYEDRFVADVEEVEDIGPDCTSCGDEITGAIWNGGRCLHCHEASLLPETAEDRWHYAHDD